MPLKKNEKVGPIDIECPWCKAPKGTFCKTPAGYRYPRWFHQRRIDLAEAKSKGITVKEVHRRHKEFKANGGDWISEELLKFACQEAMEKFDKLLTGGESLTEENAEGGAS